MPSSTDCHITGFFCTAARGGSCKVHSAAMMNRKLIASITNAHAAPSAWMTRPAGAGPAVVVNCGVGCITELAATSCSRPTIDGLKADAAGNENACARANVRPTQYDLQRC